MLKKLGYLAHVFETTAIQIASIQIKISVTAHPLFFTRIDWGDQYILWIRADFGIGGDGSVIETSWFPVSFKPSTLAISPDLRTIYAANKVLMMLMLLNFAVLLEETTASSTLVLYNSHARVALNAALTTDGFLTVLSKQWRQAWSWQHYIGHPNVVDYNE